LNGSENTGTFFRGGRKFCLAFKGKEGEKGGEASLGVGPEDKRGKIDDRM